jgi:undecaprenyl-diphosphatase
MTLFEAFVLGMIQGLTEFLPVSSSGHIQIGSFLFGIDPKENLLFSVIVHGATVLSTIIVLRKDIADLITQLLKFEWNKETKFVVNIFISMIPVFIVGLFFKEQVEAFFEKQIIFVAAMLMITGLLLAATQFLKTFDNTGDVTPLKAFIIGLAQAFAVLPGISRSGATIATAMILGVEKEEATKFSFLMVIIPILGISLLQVKDIIESPVAATSIPISSLIVGFFAALIFGILACKWMLSIVRKGKLMYFATYCFIVATLIIIVEYI